MQLDSHKLDIAFTCLEKMQRFLSGVYITELSYSSWIHIRMLTLPLVLVESSVACLFVFAPLSQEVHLVGLQAAPP